RSRADPVIELAVQLIGLVKLHDRNFRIALDREGLDDRYVRREAAQKFQCQHRMADVVEHAEAEYDVETSQPRRWQFVKVQNAVVVPGAQPPMHRAVVIDLFAVHRGYPRPTPLRLEAKPPVP